VLRLEKLTKYRPLFERLTQAKEKLGKLQVEGAGDGEDKAASSSESTV